MTRSGTIKSETSGILAVLSSKTATPSLSEPEPTVVGIAIKYGFSLLFSFKVNGGILSSSPETLFANNSLAVSITEPPPIAINSSYFEKSSRVFIQF